MEQEQGIPRLQPPRSTQHGAATPGHALSPTGDPGAGWHRDRKARSREHPCSEPGFRGGSEQVPNPHKKQPKTVGAVNVMLTGVRS